MPAFEKLQNSKLRDKYFVRNLEWSWLDEKMIQVFDNKGNKPRIITMDPWPQQIFLDANGQKTIKEYVLWMADLYEKNKIPEELDETILSTINNLIDDGNLIGLKDEKTKLAPNVEFPVSHDR